MRLTKIVATIGPATESKEMLEKVLPMINVCRCNFSHGDFEEHGNKIKNIRAVDPNMSILLDTRGPEIRTGHFEGDLLSLKKGNEIKVVEEDMLGNSEKMCLNYKGLYNEIKINERIMLDDGKITLIVKEIKGTDIVCTIANDGKIKNRRGVNTPDTVISLPFLNEKDKADIMFGIENDVDYYALSFVNTAKDVLQVKKILDDNGAKAKIISKIESVLGVENYDEILEASDGIMVARGDLGVEIEVERVPLVQKELIKKAVAKGKFTIVATHMLDSMVANPRPTRAEVSDVVNAVFDKTDCVMLSAESANGDYPMEAINVMDRTIRFAEEQLKPLKISKPIENFSDFIPQAVCNATFQVGAKAIVAPSKSGYTIKRISAFRPKVPILGFVPDAKIARMLGARYGVHVFVDDVRINNGLDKSIAHLQEKVGLGDEDVVVLTGGQKNKQTDTMIIEKIKNLI